MFNNINKVIRGAWFFFLGKIFSIFVYDRKYLSGKYFDGKCGGICSIGWRWVVTDCMGRILLGLNRGVPFPISPKMSVVNPQNIYFHNDDLNNFQGSGSYYQALDQGKIVIGKGSWIAPNVGLITTNHDVSNPDKHLRGKDIIIGEKCWIGMNSVILPGVILGPHTTVGAGSIVTKSFSDGYCVISGNPARKLRDIDLN
jgi:acetyltransferase-like isoleucine patch superfamily enzyme